MSKLKFPRYVRNCPSKCNTHAKPFYVRLVTPYFVLLLRLSNRSLAVILVCEYIYIIGRIVFHKKLLVRVVCAFFTVRLDVGLRRDGESKRV